MIQRMMVQASATDYRKAWCSTQPVRLRLPLRVPLLSLQTQAELQQSENAWVQLNA